MKTKMRYRQIETLSEQPLGVQEASGVASLGKGRFLVVDDEHGLFHCTIADRSKPLSAGVGLADLEGVCVTPDGDAVYLLAERDGSVWRYGLEAGRAGANEGAPPPTLPLVATPTGKLGRGERVGHLPRLSKKKNQGWEGIAIAPAGTWGPSVELVAVHQAKPRALAICALDMREPRVQLRLPKIARKALGDLNDVAVDPRNGHLLVLSGKVGRIAELSLVNDELKFVACYRVKTSRHDVPEGLTVDGEGRLWLVTDGKGHLRELRRT